jgi:hypothetical protein
MCSVTWAARERAHRGDPYGDKDENYDEDKPDQVHFVQLGLQRIFRSVFGILDELCTCVLIPVRPLAAGPGRRGGFESKHSVAGERNGLLGFGCV